MRITYIFIVVLIFAVPSLAVDAEGDGDSSKSIYIAIVSDPKSTTLISPSRTPFRTVRSILKAAQNFTGFPPGHGIALAVDDSNGFDSDAKMVLLVKQTGSLVEIAFTKPYPYPHLRQVADSIASLDPGIEISIVKMSDLAEANGSQYQWIPAKRSKTGG